MHKHIGLHTIAFFIVQLLFILVAFYEMIFSDAFYIPYFCVLIFSVLCLFWNYGSRVYLGNKEKWGIGILSFVFMLMISLSNYELWESGGIINIVLCLALLAGAFLAWWNILAWLAFHDHSINWREGKSWKPGPVFLVVFVLIAGINMTILFQCKYPGILTPDSINQMMQLLANRYGNHHPFWHTVTIKVFIIIGQTLFHDINAAVALYSCCSIIVMAASFAFSVATVAELQVPRWIIVLLTVFFTLMPYHIMYSMTMWKDIGFGAFVLLFSIFLFRCAENMNMSILNHIGLFVSSLGMSLYRSNGLFVFACTVICFFIMWKFYKKKLLLIMLGALICGFVMKHPLLKALSINQPDVVESLSIPVQQISRDVIENDDFTEEQIDLLNEIIDVEKISESYTPIISDPIKNLIREKNNQNYIKQHARDFIGLYTERVIKHPSSYIKGWVDQTRGYWNAGYPYWHWANSVEPNSLGIVGTIKNSRLDFLLSKYLSEFENNRFLRIFISIGFFDWLVLVALFIAFFQHDKIGIMLTIPMIMNVVSLLIATPVFSEMRYDYAVFCALPVVVTIILRPQNDLLEKEENDGLYSGIDSVL